MKYNTVSDISLSIFRGDEYETLTRFITERLTYAEHIGDVVTGTVWPIIERIENGMVFADPYASITDQWKACRKIGFDALGDREQKVLGGVFLEIDNPKPNFMKLTKSRAKPALILAAAVPAVAAKAIAKPKKKRKPRKKRWDDESSNEPSEESISEESPPSSERDDEGSIVKKVHETRSKARR